MSPMRLAAMTVLILGLAMPALADGYKSNYPEACSVVWGAVKTTLAQQARYDVKNADDKQMSVDYQIKNQSAVQVTGIRVDRVNHVALAAKGTGCTMQITTDYTGWSHYDVTDFKKHVEALLASRKVTPTK